MSTGDQPSVSVSDLALAKIAAQVTADTPGVARLAPTLGRVVKSALVKAARSITHQSNPTHQEDAGAGDVDPGAVDLDRHDDGMVGITVRIIASGEPTVLDTVNAIQVGVQRAVLELAHLRADVTVIVVDTEHGPTGEHGFTGGFGPTGRDADHTREA